MGVTKTNREALLWMNIGCLCEVLVSRTRKAHIDNAQVLWKQIINRHLEEELQGAAQVSAG